MDHGDYDVKTLGARVTTFRQSIGMTQAELARALGLSQSAVHSYEIGERRISVKRLIQLTLIFKVTLEEMLDIPSLSSTRTYTCRLSPRIIRHAELIQTLTKRQQKLVLQLIDTLHANSF